MKASYSRSVTTGISAVLQQHLLRCLSPSRAALSRAGHTVRGMEGVNDATAGVEVEACDSGLIGRITDLGNSEAVTVKKAPKNCGKCH